MSRKSKELTINLESMSVNVPFENGKVMIAVIDGKRGIARITEAVEHGMTTIETVNGQSKRIHYDEKEMF
ncbi:XtrA/YqaO family protein [Schinkia sp. CFF1]